MAPLSAAELRAAFAEICGAPGGRVQEPAVRAYLGRSLPPRQNSRVAAALASTPPARGATAAAVARTLAGATATTTTAPAAAHRALLHALAGDGRALCEADLRELAAVLCAPATPADVSYAFRLLDRDGDGELGSADWAAMSELLAERESERESDARPKH